MNKSFQKLEGSWIDAILDILPSDIDRVLGIHIAKSKIYYSNLAISGETGIVKYESKCARDETRLHRMGIWKLPKLGDFIHRDMQGVVRAVKEYDSIGNVLTARVDFYAVSGHSAIPNFGDESIEQGMLLISKELDGRPLRARDIRISNPIVVKVLLCVLGTIQKNDGKH